MKCVSAPILLLVGACTGNSADSPNDGLAAQMTTTVTAGSASDMAASVSGNTGGSTAAASSTNDTSSVASQPSLAGGTAGASASATSTSAAGQSNSVDVNPNGADSTTAQAGAGGATSAGGAAGTGGSVASVTPAAGGGTGGESAAGAGAGGTGGAANQTETGDPSGICPADPGTAPSGTTAATIIEVELPDYDFHLFEGAAWLGDALYFSDINTNMWHSTIRKYVPGTGMVTDFLPDAGSNGLAVDAGGVLHSATTAKQEISRYDLARGTQETAVPGPFNSPNDLTIASDGTIYFSDPQQGELPAGNQPQLVHVVKDGVDAIFSEAITTPNGVTLSPANDILYVSGGGYAGYVKKVTLNDGLAGSIEDIVTDLEVPDGMTKDCAGNLYVAVHEAQEVRVYDPMGSQLATVSLGAAANGQAAKPTNIAFGGADRKTLYITASYSLWQVPLQIAGYPD